MKYSLILFFLLLFFELGFCQSSGINKKCLAEEAVKIRTISPDSIDFRDLVFLKETLKDVEIVMLGEQSHGDGATFETKIRLIKFLHEEMGYDVIAFESGLYSCKKTWELIKSGERTDTTVRKGIYFPWTYSQQLQSLFSYIDEQKSKNNPLILSGFDSFDYPFITRQYLVNDLTLFMDSLELPLHKTDKWKEFTDAYQRLITAKTKNRKKDSRIVQEFLSLLNEQLNSFKANASISFWKQWTKSTISYYRDDFKRDPQMANNLLWLKNSAFPGKKIICWGATSHFLYNSDQVNFTGIKERMLVNAYYRRNPSMGGFVKEQLGDKLYSIGFTCYEGEARAFGNRKTSIVKIETAAKNSLESAFNSSGAQNSFLNLRTTSCLVANEKVLTRPLGYSYMKVVLPTMMDGIIFNKTMTPSRSIFEK